MKRCNHEWRFVPAVIVSIGHPYPTEVETHNAECGKCGALTWAHRGGSK